MQRTVREITADLNAAKHEYDKAFQLWYGGRHDHSPEGRAKEAMGEKLKDEANKKKFRLQDELIKARAVESPNELLAEFQERFNGICNEKNRKDEIRRNYLMRLVEDCRLVDGNESFRQLALACEEKINQTYQNRALNTKKVILSVILGIVGLLAGGYIGTLLFNDNNDFILIAVTRIIGAIVGVISADILIRKAKV